MNPKCALLGTQPFLHAVPGHLVLWNLVNSLILSKHLLTGIIYSAGGGGGGGALSMPAILNFEFSAGKRKATSWFQPFFLNQRTQKNPGTNFYASIRTCTMWLINVTYPPTSKECSD